MGSSGKQNRSRPRGPPCCGPICENSEKLPYLSVEASAYAKWQYEASSGKKLYTAWSIRYLGRLLNAFSKFSLTRTESGSMRFGNLPLVWTAASHPPLTPTPFNCLGER